MAAYRLVVTIGQNASGARCGKGSPQKSMSSNNQDSLPSVEGQKKTRPTDEDIIKYENDIREQQVNIHPLVSVPLPISILRDEYATSENPNFILKIADLESNYEFFRKSRGDGNCFFRAFSFGLVEWVCGHADQAVQIESLSKEITELLGNAGFDRLAYEDFFEELVSTLKECPSADSLAAEWEASPHRSHSLVVLMRLVASAFLRQHAGDYEPFLWEMEATEGSGVDMVSFCQRYVECLGVESDQIHIIALGNALGCEVQVAYLDGSDGPLNRLSFSPNQSRGITINLLYRPGHYDLLYPK